MGETTIKNTILEHEPSVSLVDSGVMPSFIAQLLCIYWDYFMMHAIWNIEQISGFILKLFC